MNLTLISAAIAAILGFAAGYQWQADIITQLKLEYEQQQSSDARSAFQKFETGSERVRVAQSKAKVRRADTAVARNRAVDIGNGLRITATSAVQASSSSLDACNATADTLRTILDESSKALVEMASDADSWQSDSMMLIESWPK